MGVASKHDEVHATANNGATEGEIAEKTSALVSDASSHDGQMAGE